MDRDCTVLIDAVGPDAVIRVQQDRPLRRGGRPTLAALRYPNQQNPVDAAILCDLPEERRQTLPMPSLGGRAVVLSKLGAFVTSYASREEIEERKTDAKRFLADPLYSADVL